MGDKKTVDRRDLYKRYLEEKKVMDTFSRIVVSLYEKSEKPQDPLTYIRDFLAPDTGGIDIMTIRAENITMSRKIADMNARIAAIEKKAAETARKRPPPSEPE
jgi:hypothetical protein